MVRGLWKESFSKPRGMLSRPSFERVCVRGFGLKENRVLGREIKYMVVFYVHCYLISVI